MTNGGTAPGPGDLWASGNAVEAASTPAVEPAAPDPDAPPFGWYTDPSGQYQVRYWDGTRWTEHVASDGVPGIDFP